MDTRGGPYRGRLCSAVGDAMTIAAAQVGAALANAEPQAEFEQNGLAVLAERANGELDAWGHAGHEVTLERVIPFYGDTRVLR